MNSDIIGVSNTEAALDITTPEGLKRCENCEKLFLPSRYWQKYCSRFCGVDHWGKLHPRIGIRSKPINLSARIKELETELEIVKAELEQERDAALYKNV